VTGTSDGPGHGAQFTVSLPAVVRRRDTDTAREPAAVADAHAALNDINVAKDTEYFEHLVMDTVKAEPADEISWRGVLRIDPHTFRAITTAGGKDVVDEEIETMRRILAMVFARTLQAYGVRPEMPPRWKDRRDPNRQTPRPGGKRAMDVTRP
jgi:hypothetical protein